MRALHAHIGWLAVAVCGVVGLWGVALALRGREAGGLFWWGVGTASILTLAQVALGVAMSEGRDAGDQHVFYGMVTVFVLAFAYIYRSQMRRRPGLYYGLMFLFVMGLGLRAITTLGLDF